MQVNSNNDISTEGNETNIINNTNANLCSMDILLDENNIAKHNIKIVINKAIPAYFDCSEPKNKASKLICGLLFLYILILYMIERKIKNDNHIKKLLITINNGHSLLFLQIISEI